MPATRRSGSSRQATDDIEGIVQGLRRVVRALETYSQEVLRDFGLTGPQLWALKALQRDEALTVGQLAEELCVHQSSLSVLLNRLETRGLVRRVRLGHDRRFVSVILTSRGQTLAAKAPEPAQGRLLHGLSAMSPGKVRAIRRAIDGVVEAMEAQGVKARFFFSEE